jgi:hypothetical protein
MKYCLIHLIFSLAMIGYFQPLMNIEPIGEVSSLYNRAPTKLVSWSWESLSVCLSVCCVCVCVYLADAFIDVVTCSAGSAKKRRRGKRRKNIPGDISTCYYWIGSITLSSFLFFSLLTLNSVCVCVYCIYIFRWETLGGRGNICYGSWSTGISRRRRRSRFYCAIAPFFCFCFSLFPGGKSRRRKSKNMCACVQSR